jgi:hypothetical protein
MKRLLLTLALALAAALWAPLGAQAAFGLHGLDVTFDTEDGSTQNQAGSHPFAMTTSLSLNTVESQLIGFETPDGDIKDLTVTAPPGLVVDRGAVPQCTTAEFLPGGGQDPLCARATTVGTIDVAYSKPGNFAHSRVYNLTPAPGEVARLGFVVEGFPLTIDLSLSQTPPYTGIARVSDALQVFAVYSSHLTLWGVPAAPAHDAQRGGAVDGAERPFLTLPTSCTGPLSTLFEATSWQGGFFEQTIFSHGEGGEPLGMSGCQSLAFGPSITAAPTTKAAQSPTGLDFSLDVADEGLRNPAPEATAASEIRKAVITLPEGMSANPSLAEGLNVCSEAGLEAETLAAAPGQGCPDASKIGTLEVESPLLEGELLKGSLYIAKPYENPFNSLLALYIVIKDPALGIIVKQAAKIEPDPVTGQLVTTTEEIPQLPFSHFRLHFREGGRSPLISPPTCGSHAVTAKLFPWSGGPAVETDSAFQIVSGPDSSPCPSGGVAPFHPGFTAGSINNSAGAFSPFDMRLTRKDGEQEMTKFSTVLPPGVLGKLAGVSRCPDSAIAQAKSRTGPHGGQEELEHPSCPAASKIGRTLAGAGVGSQLTYVPGSLYLAGPIGGDPLSVVAITPALAGPFDAGTVVVRVALTLNPVTAEVEVDGAHSDPIPHILKGIPLNVRDLRVYADRPNFTLNPTDCEPSAARATLFGSFLNPLDPADDVPVGLSSRYQAANCAALGFAPKLDLRLKGGTKRGAFPALTGTYTPRPGDANLKGLVLRFPHSAFLEQGHFGTICTRVQFAAKACPAQSVYGQATAYSPLLDEPLQGPVYLRSSNHNLPDFVAALHGIVDVETAARIDSAHGGIRATFADLPDAPLTKVVVQMQGGKKGLIVNSTDLCAGANHANAQFSGQNGKRRDAKPAVRAAGCGKGLKRGAHRRPRG